MQLRHWLFLAIVLFVGYFIGVKYPTLLKSIPGVSKVV